MSDQEPQTAPDESTAGTPGDPGKPRKPMAPWVRWVIGAAAVLVMLFVVAFAGNLAAERRDKQRLQQGVDALAVALRDPLLERERTKLRRLAQNIQQQADYDLVMIALENGRVLASTDSRFEDEVHEGLVEHLQAIEERKKTDPEAGSASVEKIDGNRWRAVRGVWLENNPIGGIVIETSR